MTDKQNLPRHIAIIMDGNGRWARQRSLPRVAGHRAGVDSVRTVINSCIEHRIEVLTLFAFSSENWRRPRREVGMLMDLFLRSLEQEADRLHASQVRVQVIGDLGAFNPRLNDCIRRVRDLTAGNTGLKLNVAANYGGRWDITQAARKLAGEVQDGHLPVDQITPERIQAALCMADQPEPDLFIRTGGEQRISNFLLWQLAYTELYFTDLLWPAFDEAAFSEALNWYATRERRFGRTGEQLERAQDA